MGMMTLVGILNDRLHDIAENPQRFVDYIMDAIHQNGTTTQVGRATVLPSHHADNPTVTLAYGNTFMRVTEGIESMGVDELKRRVQFAELARQTAQGDRWCVEHQLLTELMKQPGMKLAKAKKEVLASRKF